MILQYSNDIYPMALWVGNIDDIEKAVKLFKFYYDTDELNRDEEPIDKTLCRLKQRLELHIS